ncbi:putative DNA-directed RNA polymerase I subunit RPA4 [Podospora australis]|uniref:DNA-directed RNA polymerase subunit n=1 Tax=Podospora australis TaxID=1536484 RepID=A0AAN7AGZ5_9PEZI|nr:putative DNA-directed RNA polymerase I subunit RPA4 [Podospora australis]
MSATLKEGSQPVVIPDSQKTEKKHKRSKSEKKRTRDDDDDDEPAVVQETPRKSKKVKNEDLDAPEDSSIKKEKKKRDQDANGEAQPEIAAAADESKTPRKKSKSKKTTDEVPAADDVMEIDTPRESKPEKKRKDKKSKKEDTEIVDGEKKKKKSKDKTTQLPFHPAPPSAAHTPDSTDLLPSSDSVFPFYTQSISLYVPFFPVGFDKPLTNVAAQHLDPLLNHYSPLLRGVLLGYSNLNLSDRPVKASLVTPPTDETPAYLHSVDEYAVGFGFLTFDAQLFVPSRGKWMEGVVQLQSEGHIGVVCWNKFNASIEAKRLPPGWKWVDLAKSGGSSTYSRSSSAQLEESGEQGEEEEEEETESKQDDVLDGEELQVVEQIHSTGHWIDERGKKVSGKLRFRIKNFDVGQAGDYGYLSIEGTCLDIEQERALSSEEREAEKRRKAKHNPQGLLKPLSRRVPEFSMTKFGKEDEEEDGTQRTVLYKGSRPGTPDD